MWHENMSGCASALVWASQVAVSDCLRTCACICISLSQLVSRPQVLPGYHTELPKWAPHAAHSRHRLGLTAIPLILPKKLPTL